jgi:hypothetical protein
MLVQARQPTLHVFRAPQSGLNRHPLLQRAWSQRSSKSLRIVGSPGGASSLNTLRTTSCRCVESDQSRPVRSLTSPSQKSRHC